MQAERPFESKYMVGGPDVLTVVPFACRTEQFSTPWIESEILIHDQVLGKIQPVAQALYERKIHVCIEISEEIVALVKVILLTGQSRVQGSFVWIGDVFTRFRIDRRNNRRQGATHSCNSRPVAQSKKRLGTDSQPVGYFGV